MKRIRIVACSTLLTLPLLTFTAATTTTTTTLAPAVSAARRRAAGPAGRLTLKPMLEPALNYGLDPSMYPELGKNVRQIRVRGLAMTQRGVRSVHLSYSPAPAERGGSVRDMIVQVFGLDAAKATQVAMCESGLNPQARNTSGASGIFQFLPSTWAMTPYHASSPFNAWANINAAHWLFVRDGRSWREWQCGAA